MLEHFHTLGLEPGATPKKIKEAYIIKANKLLENKLEDIELELHYLKIAFLNLIAPEFNDLEENLLTTSPQGKKVYRTTTTMQGIIPIKITFLGIENDGRQKLINSFNSKQERKFRLKDLIPYHFKDGGLNYKLLLCNPISVEKPYYQDLDTAFKELSGARVAIVILDLDDDDRLSLGIEILNTLIKKRENYPDLQILLLGLTKQSDKNQQHPPTPEVVTELMQEYQNLFEYNCCYNNNNEEFREIIQNQAVIAYKGLSDSNYLRLELSNNSSSSTSTSSSLGSTGLFSSIRKLVGIGMAYPAAPNSDPAASSQLPVDPKAAFSSKIYFHS